jgi:hypothetical protein
MRIKNKHIKGGDIAQTIYDDTVAFGIFMALIYLIIGFIIGTIMIIIGIYLLIKKNFYSKSTNAKIISNSECSNNTITSQNSKYSNSTSTSLQCISDITYNINSKNYSSKLSTGSLYYPKDESIKIYYNPKNPLQVIIKPPNWKMVGAILLIIGILIIGGVIFNYYIANTYKFAAAATGVSTVI